MKLYTEEQMIQAFAYGKTLEPFDCFEDMIDSLTPIELPSDEEISEKLAFHAHGARWVINHINQQKDINVPLLNNKTMENKKPDLRLIDSMAMRYRHDFGLLSENEKNGIRVIMTQLWEEVVGLGFYKQQDK